jgi:hypothetical protein
MCHPPGPMQADPNPSIGSVVHAGIQLLGRPLRRSREISAAVADPPMTARRCRSASLTPLRCATSLRKRSKKVARVAVYLRASPSSAAMWSRSSRARSLLLSRTNLLPSPRLRPPLRPDRAQDAGTRPWRLCRGQFAARHAENRSISSGHRSVTGSAFSDRKNGHHQGQPHAAWTCRVGLTWSLASGGLRSAMAASHVT